MHEYTCCGVYPELGCAAGVGALRRQADTVHTGLTLRILARLPRERGAAVQEGQTDKGNGAEQPHTEDL